MLVGQTVLEDRELTRSGGCHPPGVLPHGDLEGLAGHASTCDESHWSDLDRAHAEQFGPWEPQHRTDDMDVLTEDMEVHCVSGAKHVYPAARLRQTERLRQHGQEVVTDIEVQDSLFGRDCHQLPAPLDRSPF